MTKICSQIELFPSNLLFLCDFTPTKDRDISSLVQAQYINSELISVAYGPGRLVRSDSLSMAYLIKQKYGKNPVVTIPTRDMNKLAIQSHLLGADMLGLENILVVAGDDFNSRELKSVKQVRHFSTTGLIASIKEMNRGYDYRGSSIGRPTNFCIGATINFGQEKMDEVLLTCNKRLAGADFFITEPVFALDKIQDFMDLCDDAIKGSIRNCTFVGLQMLSTGGIVFGTIPESLQNDLDKGRDPMDISMELLEGLISIGLNRIYLLPSVLDGGHRDYEAANILMDFGNRLVSK